MSTPSSRVRIGSIELTMLPSSGLMKEPTARPAKALYCPSRWERERDDAVGWSSHERCSMATGNHTWRGPADSAPPAAAGLPSQGVLGSATNGASFEEGDDADQGGGALGARQGRLRDRAVGDARAARRRGDRPLRGGRRLPQ